MVAVLRAFTEDEREDVARRYRAGETMQEIATSVGRSPTAVRNALIACGVSRRTVGYRRKKGACP